MPEPIMTKKEAEALKRTSSHRQIIALAMSLLRAMDALDRVDESACLVGDDDTEALAIEVSALLREWEGTKF